MAKRPSWQSASPNHSPSAPSTFVYPAGDYSDLPAPSPGAPEPDDPPLELQVETFEQVIARSEPYWQAVMQADDQENPQKIEHAKRILAEIGRVRELLSDARDADRLDEAVVLGMHLQKHLRHARRVFGEGTRLRSGQASREGGKKGGKAVREERAMRQAKLQRQVDLYVASHPSAATRSIAMNVLPAGRRGDTKAIDAMAKRIARLKK
jgi:hypothetical protein